MADGKADNKYLCLCGVTFEYLTSGKVSLHYSTCLYPTATKDLDASHGICDTCYVDMMKSDEGGQG